MRTKPETTYTKIRYAVHADTAKALLISPDDNNDNAVWVPKSTMRSIESVPQTAYFTGEIAEWIYDKNNMAIPWGQNPPEDDEDQTFDREDPMGDDERPPLAHPDDDFDDEIPF
jgi:hypothetical protein